MIDVGGNADSRARGQREEESIVDDNAEIFDTNLVDETVETAKGKLEVLKGPG